MVNQTGKILYNFWSIVLGYFLGIHSRENLFFLIFGRDPMTPLSKLFLPKFRYQGDERCLLDLETMRYALPLGRKIYLP